MFFLISQQQDNYLIELSESSTKNTALMFNRFEGFHDYFIAEKLDFPFELDNIKTNFFDTSYPPFHIFNFVKKARNSFFSTVFFPTFK